MKKKLSILLVFVLVGFVGVSALIAVDVKKNEPAQQTDQLKESCKMFEDLERQIFFGKVNFTKAQKILDFILHSINQSYSVVDDNNDTIFYPILIPADDKDSKIKEKNRFKPTKNGLFDGKKAFDSSYFTILIPDKNADGRWDRSQKSIKLISPETGIVVALTPKIANPPEPRGRLIAVYSPESKNLWFFSSISWSDLKVGDKIKAGSVIAHLASSNSNYTKLKVWLFNVRSNSDINYVNPKTLLTKAKRLNDVDVSK